MLCIRIIGLKKFLISKRTERQKVKLVKMSKMRGSSLNTRTKLIKYFRYHAVSSAFQSKIHQQLGERKGPKSLPKWGSNPEHFESKK